MVLGSHSAAAPTTVTNDAMLDAKQRQLLFIQESQRMVKKSQQLIKVLDFILTITLACYV